MFNILANLRYRAKLSLAFLLLSIIPIAAIGAFFQISYSQNIEEHVFDKLVSIRDSKKSEIEHHLKNTKAQAKLFSQGNHVRYSISPYLGFSYAFDLIDKNPKVAAQKLVSTYRKHKNFFLLSSSYQNQTDGYAGVNFRFDGGYQDFAKSFKFSNILLITPKGQIVYSTAKAQYFGQNISYKTISNSPVSNIYKKILARQLKGEALKNIVEFVDFSWDQITKQEVAYLAFPIIQHGRFSGIIVYAIPETSLTEITGRRDGLGKTGEAYLIGQDFRPRSRLAAFGANPNDYSLKILTLKNLQLKTIAATNALSGLSSITKNNNYANVATLAAFDYIDFLGYKWALIVEISEDEALEKSLYFRNLIWGLGAFITLLIIVIVYYLSGLMTQPLNSLMLATEMVSRGDLDLSIKGSGRNDELGSLARSFVTMQHSIRKQIAFINDVNAELEEKISTIEIQNKELHTADKLKDEFLANTSHELRTPLNGIIGITESLLDGAAGTLTDAQKTQFNMVCSSANRLSLLVNDLLDFHKIRHNQLHIDTTPVDVAMIVNHIIELSKHLVGKKDIKITKDIPNNLPKISADTIRFEQILFNLVGNAIKYTNEGEIEISAHEQSGQVIFRISDTGIGMTPADQNRIFKPFEQADGGITRKIGGSGLGLAISKKLVELMQGEMHVETQLDIGSTFSFNLQIANENLLLLKQNTDYDANPINENKVISYIEPERLLSLLPIETDSNKVVKIDIEPTRETILVVDDEDINLQILHNHLSLMGYNVLLAKDAAQAFTLLAQENPALIILDIMLPEISGFKIARTIREKYDLYELPILMLTARAQISDLVEGFNSGANDYVVKPFLKDELMSRVRTLLDAKQGIENLKENIRLKEEVSRRLETENELRNSQRGMLRMLDSIEDAIITFNSFDQIAFFNQAAHLKLGFQTRDMIGKNMHQLIPKSQLAEVRKQLKQKDRGQMIIDIQKSNGATLNLSAYIARVGGFRSDDIAIILHQEDEISSQAKLPAIENALTNTQNIIEKEGIQYLTKTQAEPIVESAKMSLSKLKLDYRHLLVDAMNDSLELWHLSSGLNKIDLAEQSNIWRVYMDRSSLQTRTLDKYFLEETLPSKPRWRHVLRTGNFVLKYINALTDKNAKASLIENPQYQRLSENLVQLKNHVGK
ncbi:MAG: response regulator [Rhizobiales bacterium]|nr:response regulator [Hyphomicrobiales bacterium]